MSRPKLALKHKRNGTGPPESSDKDQRNGAQKGGNKIKGCVTWKNEDTVFDDSFGKRTVVVYLRQRPSCSRFGVQWEATPECIPAVAWNIPRGFSNDLLMALMSLHRGARLCMGLLERREGGK